MTKLSKTFIKFFVDTCAFEPKPIAELKQFTTKDLNINDELTITSYAKSADSLLLICLLGRKKLNVISYYEHAIDDSDIIINPYIQKFTNIYFLFFRNNKEYLVYLLSNVSIHNDKLNYNLELQLRYDLKNFMNIFKDSKLIGSNLRKDIANELQKIYNQLQCSADKRMMFITLVWLLLKNNDIKFVKFADNKEYSLSEYFDFVVEHSSIYAEQIMRLERKKIPIDPIVARNQEIILETTGYTLIDAFGKLIEYKMKHHNSNDTGMFKNQLDKFKYLVESIQNNTTTKYALGVANTIYDFIYKKYDKNIDIYKYVFDLNTKYTNRYSLVSSKGEVHTHTMLKNMIMTIFKDNVKPNSVCYDPTCGTGGFSETFYKYCESKGYNDVVAYGTEINEDTSLVAWICGICSNIDVRIFNDNCFNKDIKDKLISTESIDFLLMNPPYGIKSFGDHGPLHETEWIQEAEFDEKRQKRKLLPEWTFCRYNLDTYTKHGGWFAFVIPSSCVSENKQNKDDKQKLLECSEIWYVIKIREDIFTPQAGKACCVIIGRYIGCRSQDEMSEWKTKCIDFTNDGGEIKKKKGEVEYNDEDIERLWYERILDDKCMDGVCKKFEKLEKRIKPGMKKQDIWRLEQEITDEEDDDEDEIKYGILNILHQTNENGKEWYEERVLTAKDNWIYTRKEKINGVDLKQKFYNMICERITTYMKNVGAATDWSKMSKKENDDCEWREVKISDLFEFVQKEKHNSKVSCPLISCSGHNNGVSKYVNYYEFDGKYITVATCGDSSAGLCFVQEDKFAINELVVVIKLKDKYKYLENDLLQISSLMTFQFRMKYSFSYMLNRTRLMNEHINLPFRKSTNNIDFTSTNAFDLTDAEELRTVNIRDIFEIAPKLKNVKYTDNAEYPFISCSGHNNGVSKYVNYYEYDGVYMTVATNGSLNGTCFVQNGKFAVASDVIVLKLQDEYNYLGHAMFQLSFMLTFQINMKYSYSYKCNRERLMNETIDYVPFCKDPKTGNKIIDVSGLQYIYIYIEHLELLLSIINMMLKQLTISHYRSKDQ